MERSEIKFQAGDVVKVRSGSEPMTVIDYEVNNAGAFMNALSRTGNKPFQDSVITGQVLCEWMYKGKRERGYFHQSSLELVKPLSE